MGELYALVTLANPLDGADSGTSHDLIRDDEGWWTSTTTDLSSVVAQSCHGNSQTYSVENSGKAFHMILLRVFADDGAIIRLRSREKERSILNKCFCPYY